MKNKIINGIIKDLKAIPKKYIGANGRADIKKLLIQFAPYLLAAYFINKICYGYRISPGEDFWQKGMSLCNDFAACFKNPLPSLALTDFLAGCLGGIGFKLLVIYKQKNAKKYRKGVEYGSAVWGGEKDIAPFVSDNPDDNILLTETESIRLLGRPDYPEHERNKNVLVIGGSGSGKTRFFVKPNLMQMNCSYVITDPKGTFGMESGKMVRCYLPEAVINA